MILHDTVDPSVGLERKTFVHSLIIPDVSLDQVVSKEDVS